MQSLAIILPKLKNAVLFKGVQSIDSLFAKKGNKKYLKEYTYNIKVILYDWRIYMPKQKKISVSFKETEKEMKLYNWILEQGDIIGCSGAIKQILFKHMEEQLKNNNNEK